MRTIDKAAAPEADGPRSLLRAGLITGLVLTALVGTMRPAAVDDLPR
jgi:hypothetical protein